MGNEIMRSFLIASEKYVFSEHEIGRQNFPKSFFSVAQFIPPNEWGELTTTLNRIFSV